MASETNITNSSDVSVVQELKILGEAGGASSDALKAVQSEVDALQQTLKDSVFKDQMDLKSQLDQFDRGLALNQSSLFFLDRSFNLNRQNLETGADLIDRQFEQDMRERELSFESALNKLQNQFGEGLLNLEYQKSLASLQRDEQLASVQLQLDLLQRAQDEELEARKDETALLKSQEKTQRSLLRSLGRTQRLISERGELLGRITQREVAQAEIQLRNIEAHRRFAAYRFQEQYALKQAISKVTPFTTGGIFEAIRHTVDMVGLGLAVESAVRDKELAIHEKEKVVEKGLERQIGIKLQKAEVGRAGIRAKGAIEALKIRQKQSAKRIAELDKASDDTNRLKEGYLKGRIERIKKGYSVDQDYRRKREKSLRNMAKTAKTLLNLGSILQKDKIELKRSQGYRAIYTTFKNNELKLQQDFEQTALKRIWAINDQRYIQRLGEGKIEAGEKSLDLLEGAS